ncbi:MAG: HIT domain-containing protein [Candidatus Eisenbacteria bacterium]|nr:HIT domain-containing protein [Candidatus Eisenbacteria bacterium]
MTDRPCPFCHPDPGLVVVRRDHALALRDAFPLAPGHTLIVPARHVASWFDTTEEERRDILELLSVVREQLEEELHPDGYNIGINDGAAAGQTVMHLHVHVVPRHRGDVPDPRGGIRWIFPDRADYWSQESGR